MLPSTPKITTMKNVLILPIILVALAFQSVYAQDLPDDVIYSELMIAARDGKSAQAETLIKGGADIHQKTNPYGFTALIISSMWGNDGVTRLLLDNGARVNDKDDQGNTSLIYASQFGHIEIIRMLLTSSARVNDVNEDGKNALYNASILGYDDIVELLISARSDVNLKTKTGDTALIAAASWGHIDVVKRLVDAGADKTVRNAKGKTAMDMAREKQYTAIIELLN